MIRVHSPGLPPETEYPFVEWPLLDHSPAQDRPQARPTSPPALSSPSLKRRLWWSQVLCENPNCDKTEGPSRDPAIMRTYEKHVGALLHHARRSLMTRHRHGLGLSPLRCVRVCHRAGPRDREVRAWLRRRMGVIWRERYQPAVDRDMDAYAAAHPDASADDKQKKLVGHLRTPFGVCETHARTRPPSRRS